MLVNSVNIFKNCYLWNKAVFCHIWPNHNLTGPSYTPANNIMPFKPTYCSSAFIRVTYRITGVLFSLPVKKTKKFLKGFLAACNSKSENFFCQLVKTLSLFSRHQKHVNGKWYFFRLSCFPPGTMWLNTIERIMLRRTAPRYIKLVSNTVLLIFFLAINTLPMCAWFYLHKLGLYFV